MAVPPLHNVSGEEEDKGANAASVANTEKACNTCRMCARKSVKQGNVCAVDSMKLSVSMLQST